MYRLIKRREYRGTGLHRSGWPWVVANLQLFSNPDGVLLDDFFEQSLTERDLSKRREPWIGIFHHPPFASKRLPMGHGSLAGNYFKMHHVRMAMRHLKAAVVMSPGLHSFLSKHLTCPVHLVKHPMPTTFPLFNPATLDDIEVLQFGFYMKNVQAIHELPESSTCKRFKLSSSRPYEVKFSTLCRQRSKRQQYPGVENLGRVSDDHFDYLLTRQVAFFEYFAATASNAVIECIVRNTPVVLNRLPAHEYYLGQDYPLFYDNFDEAKDLLTKERLLEGHQYLAAMNKDDLAVEPFIRVVQEAACSSRSPSTSTSSGSEIVSQDG